MTLKRYVLIMTMTTLVCWVSFGLILLRVDPYTGGSVGLVLFFVALFFAVWGTLSMLGFCARFYLIRAEIPFRHIGISLRQALWFAILITLTLLLISQELYEWWMSLLLIIGLAVLEGFFLARSIEARYYQKKKLKQRMV